MMGVAPRRGNKGEDNMGTPQKAIGKEEKMTATRGRVRKKKPRRTSEILR